MLNIWHIFHTKHKKQLLSDVTYVSKLYHLCSYRCKFATVRTNVVNQNNVFLFGFLSPLTYGLDFFSLFSHQTQLFPQQRKNKMTHSTSSWARPLRLDHRHCHCRRRCKRHGRGYSDHRHSDWIIVIVIIVGGASGMGEATPIIAIVIAAPISPISLSPLVVGGFDCWWLADFG